MAKKKKKTTSSGSRPSLLESLGLQHITQIFQNERMHFFLGMLLFAISLCLIWSFISYFTTGAADQSLIENLRSDDMSNENSQFQNAVGSLGAYASYFFMSRCFGVGAFGIPIFLFFLSLALMKAYRPPLLKLFLCIALITIWFSVVLAIFVTPLFPSSHFCLGGGHGLYIGHFLERYGGTPGLVAILAIVAILFLMYVSNETIVWIRKLLNPKKIFDKVKFTINDPSKQEDEDSYVNLIKTEDDPEVFGN